MTDNEKMTLLEKVLGDSAVIEKVINAETMVFSPQNVLN